jgi:hypothetical protein
MSGEYVAAMEDVLVLLAAAGLVGMVLVMPLAAEFGRRTGKPSASSAPVAPSQPTERPVKSA